MVKKFLTREQTYAQLLTAVSENEKKLEDLRTANEQKEEELHQLVMENDNDNGASSAENQEILRLENEISFIQKDLDIVLNRKKNIHLICDQVSGWSSKVITKLNTQLELRNNNVQNQSMSGVFKNISGLVCEQLQRIIAENKKKAELHDMEDYNVTDELNAQDLIAEITTEEFINKNIRVRPISGVTNVDREEKQSDVYGGTKGLLGADMGGPMMDEEEKFNANVNIDMEEARWKVK